MEAAFQQAAVTFVGETYFRTRKLEFELQQMLLPQAFTKPFARVLELGCGIGYKALLMKAHAKRVEGIDIHEPYHGFKGREPAVVTGQKILGEIGSSGVHLTCANYVEYLKVRPDCYDLIYSDYLLEHVPDLPPLMCAVFNSLRQGGLAVHTVPNTHDALIQLATENLQPTWRALARVGKAYVRRLMGGSKRHPRVTATGTFVPITHSEFINDYRKQFEVYRLENFVFPMMEAGFVIEAIVTTREHAYTIVCRKPGV